MVKIDFDEGGTGFGFRDGKVYPIVWKRSPDANLLTFTFEDGSLYSLKPGNTWIAIIGKSSDVSSEGLEWRFQFRTP
jgi:hypothetical protein